MFNARKRESWIVDLMGKSNRNRINALRKSTPWILQKKNRVYKVFSISNFFHITYSSCMLAELRKRESDWGYIIRWLWCGRCSSHRGVDATIKSGHLASSLLMLYKYIWNDPKVVLQKSVYIDRCGGGRARALKLTTASSSEREPYGIILLLVAATVLEFSVHSAIYINIYEYI